jgi:tetratricopeptide (TPR) repeat protein
MVNMSEPVELITDDILLPADYPDDYELATNQLRSGHLAPQQAQQSLVEEIDWLLKLRNKSLTTKRLDGPELAKDLQRPELRPSGMAAHTSAVKIVPTLGARFRTGMRRGTLMVALLALAAGVLAGSAYLLASTTWLSDLLTPPAPAAPSAANHAQPVPAQPIAGQQPAPPAASSNSASRGQVTAPNPPLPQSNPGNPSQPAGHESGSSADSSALSGLDARDLRDKGIAAYKAGNYDEAAKVLEDSVNVTSDDPVAQYQLGLAYMAVQGRDHSLDDAELAFRTATSLQPNWAAPYQMLAETLMRRGYYEQAVSPALQATQLEPTMGEAWMTLGRAYSGEGKETEATKAFAQAAKFAPAAPQP